MVAVAEVENLGELRGQIVPSMVEGFLFHSAMREGAFLVFEGVERSDLVALA